MRPWSVVEKVLDEREELGPFVGLIVGELPQDHMKNLLHLLVHPLVGAHFARSHGRTELLLDIQQGEEFCHHRILEFRPSVRTD